MRRQEIFLILHNIRSCYNVGSIFRTADAAGVEKIYLCGYTPVPGISNSQFPISPDLPKANRGSSIGYNRDNQFLKESGDKITKTALGAEKFVGWEQHKQTWRLLKELKERGIRIVALEQAPKSGNIFKYHPKFPLAVIVGHERKGLSKIILEYVDDIVEIPMFGKKESLNVAVAVGIALYQFKNASSK